MTLHVVYESAAGSTTDWATTDHIRLPTVEVSQHAEEGIAGRSTIPVEDVGGALSIVGLKRAWLWESAESAGNQVIGTFYVTDREIGRQGGAAVDDQVLSADRWWSVGLIDHNETLSRRIVTGTDGDRPAETDIARITWLLGSLYTPNVLSTTTYINTTGAVNLDKADLRGQRAYDVLAECANQSNKNFHLIPSNPTTAAGAQSYLLWYDYDYSATYDSALRLTNVLADVDNSTTFAVDPDMVLRITPERVYSGVLVRYNGGEIYAQDTDTGNAFAFRDAVHHATNLNSASAASARATRYLADADTEEERITCRFVVPKEKVNGLREGQRIQCKFSHLPNYSAAYQYLRCLRRSVRQLSDEFYEIRAELTLGIPLPLTDSNALLYGPNDNNKPGTNNGTFQVNWDATGDGPTEPGGCSLSARAGLLSYLGVTNEWTGIRCDGSGTVTVDTEGTFSGATLNSPINLSAKIMLNGAMVREVTHTQGSGAVSWTWHMSGTSLSVRSGDEITVQVTVAGMGAGDPLVIPAGTGSCQNLLWVRGDLG